MQEYTYEILDSNYGNEEQVIMRSDGLYIPADPANSDYQEYLAQLEADK
jgi:hypothetical protein